jgi:long-chain-fatty-acid--CoA ligase ACSBG
MTLKTLPNPLNSNQPGNDLSMEAIAWCRSVGSQAETVFDIIKDKDENIFFAVQDAIDKVNEEAVSKAAKIQKWTILPKDLSIDGGELGPTLKLKRFYFYEKYNKAIDRMYE